VVDLGRGAPQGVQPDPIAGTAEAVRNAIVLDGVSFSYPGGVRALGQLTLSIASNRVTGIAGPSGCGKSTMLYLLAGLYRPEGGKILWQTEPGASASGRHPLAMVFQKDTLLPWLTVSENVGFSFTFNRIDQAEAKSRVDWLLEMVGLSEFAKAYPYQLSGGMRRRVAFLTAVAPFPSVLLLDEPFSSLDEPTRVAIHQDVLTIIREMRMTVVLVTHDLGEAISLCDEVAILTRRPGSVASRYEIPFGAERNILDLRQDRLFLELYGQLWRELSRQLEPGSKRSGARDR